MTGRLEQGHFYGSCRTQKKFRDTALSLFEYDAFLKTPFHAHEWAYFTFMIDGQLNEKCGLRHEDFRKHALVFHHVGDPHDGVSGNSGARVMFIEIGPSRLQLLEDAGGLPDAWFDKHHGEAAWAAYRIFRRFRENDLQDDLVLEGMLLELLGAAIAVKGEGTRKPPWLKQVLEYLHDEPAAVTGVTEIAAAVGVHPVHLTRVFRKFFQITIPEYRHRLRILEACRILEKQHQPIAEIAQDLGYADQSHFTRTFRKLVGKTPRRFQEDCQENGAIGLSVKKAVGLEIGP